MPDDPDLDATPICNDNEDAKAWRDEIAEAMWVQYRSVLEERAAAEDSDDDAMEVGHNQDAGDDEDVGEEDGLHEELEV